MLAGLPDPSLDHLNEIIQRLQLDVEGSAGVDLAVHSYPPQEPSERSWCFIVAMAEQDAPLEFIPGPQEDLGGAGAAVLIDPDWIDTEAITIAVTVLEAVQLTRWRHGMDPTWPPCPVHDGLHPLTFTIDPTDAQPKWLCRASHTPPSGGWPSSGDLTQALGKWGTPRSPGTLTLDEGSPGSAELNV